MDIFDLTSISDKYDEHFGLLAIVKRESEKKLSKYRLQI